MITSGATGLSDLYALSRTLGLKIEATEDFSALGNPVSIGPVTVPNALAVHPIEGADADPEGRPTPLTFRRYARFAAGGAGLIWSEAMAVSPEGRANPHQLMLKKSSKERFASLVSRTRTIAREYNHQAHHPVLVAQLSHAGRYSRPHGAKHPIIAQHNPNLDTRMRVKTDWPVVSDDFLNKLQDKYIRAAKVAFEVGFDAVDIMCCHGHLISGLLSCHERPGKYGGSFENRSRFLMEVVEGIRAGCGSDKVLAVRLGVFNGMPYPYGWGTDPADAGKPDLSEPRQLVAALEKRGVSLISVTAGNPWFTPHLCEPSNTPAVGENRPPEHPLVSVSRLIQFASDIQTSAPDVAVVGSGYSWLGAWMPYVAAAALRDGKMRLAGVARLAMAYPDFARDILSEGRLDPAQVCLTCNACGQMLYGGGSVGCAVRDNAVYGPVYQQVRLRRRDILAGMARKCRTCERAACRLACPAGIDIPAFIDKFVAGDDIGAYEVMRKSNVFPATCAQLCPTEELCEGHCLMKFIGDGPIPISQIQRYISEKAIQRGWARVSAPETASGKRVAVLGAGPCGLACAARLLEAGHSVVVFDKDADGGGMISSSIPSEREQGALANEIRAAFKDLPRHRLSFRLEKRLGPNLSLDDIAKDKYDAIFIALGLSESLATPGCKPVMGFWGAVQFLSEAKRDPLWAMAGRSVAVIGGTNLAMTAAVTAKKRGANEVYIIYRWSLDAMPVWRAEREAAARAGVHFLVMTQQLNYIERDGRISGIRVCPTRFGAPDRNGRRLPEPLVGQAYELPVEIIVEAIGQTSPKNITEWLQGVEMDRGLICLKKKKHATSRDRVFSGGDITLGPSTVAAAVADGMTAAAEINEMLSRNS